MSDVDTVAAESTVPDANPAEDVALDAAPETEATKPEPSPEAPDPGKEKDGLLKKINKLTWQRREAERERDLYRQRVEASERQVKPTEAPDTKPKTLADFEYDEGRYQQHLFSEAEKRAVTAAETRLKQEQERQAKERTQSSFRQREEAFSESVEDYLEVTRSENLKITPQMAEVITESEEGPALAYHLGKNEELADLISQLPPLAAARELGKLEARLIAEREKAKEKPISKAPPPTPQLDAASASPRVSTADASGDVLDDATWFEMERKRMARKRAGK